MDWATLALPFLCVILFLICGVKEGWGKGIDPKASENLTLENLNMWKKFRTIFWFLMTVAALFMGFVNLCKGDLRMACIVIASVLFFAALGCMFYGNKKYAGAWFY